MSDEGTKDICERYVAFVDILGFQNLIETRPLEEILDKIANVLSLVPVVSTLGHININEAKYSPNEKFKAVHLCSFSDSFVIASKDASRDSLNSIIAATFLLARGLFMGGLPVRGAIALGEAGIISGTHHIVGKAVVDAIMLERQQSWFGIMFSERILEGKNLVEWLHPTIMPLVIEYPVPLKGSLIGRAGHALNWRLNIHSQIGIRPLLPAPRKDQPDDSIKIDNTLKFLEFLRETDRRSINVTKIPGNFPHLHPAIILNNTDNIVGTELRLEHGDKY